MLEIDARVFELAPWIFFWFPVDLWAMRPDVEGWRIPAVFNGQRWTRGARAAVIRFLAGRAAAAAPDARSACSW